MEERIRRVADSQLTELDLWSRIQSPIATRESRMEVVAWIAVCKFNCSLEGGFVRDWIVGNECARPSQIIQPSEWVKFDTKTGTPSLLKELVPSDLDCKMPLDHYFDFEKFSDEVNKFNMKPQVFRSRRSYRLLFDQYESTGPFTLELIEPYSSVGFRLPDLDVNNLCIKRDQCNQLNQRVDLSVSPFFIDVKQILENIKCKTFHVLPVINELIANRINKMIARGWMQLGSPITNRHQQIKPIFIINPLSTTSDLYKTIENQMKNIIGSTILSIEQIQNSELDTIYQSMKTLVANECPEQNANEQFLFHGTHINKANQILKEGFDYGVLKINSRFGHGAYFSDNPLKSHEYTLPDNNDTETRIMFYSKVILGREMILNNTDSSLFSPPRDHHSIHGIISDTSEYIVYRLTQALPFLVITYRIHSS